MTRASIRPLPAAPSSALSAFLRGIERRAFVLALAQCGRAEPARQAVGEAIRSFRGISASTPLSSWPASFWALLLAQPELAQPESGPAELGQFRAGESLWPELAVLSSGPRAALLLRLVAGLDFGHASQVLGVSESAFRYASQRALQHLGEAGVSYAGLAAVRERLHRQIKTLSEPELVALSRLRELALSDQPTELPLPPPAPTRRRWRLGLWLALAGLVLGFAATYWPTPEPVLAPGRSQPLGADDGAPARPPFSAADAVSHPDFDLLARPDDLALAEQLARLSWLSRGVDGFPAEPEPAVAAEPGEPDETAGQVPEPVPAAMPASARALLAPLAQAWPSLDAATRARLLGNVGQWQALTAVQQAGLRQRLLAWDAQPAIRRAQQRSTWLAWQRLPNDEQSLLRATAGRWAALPGAGRAALAARFEALPADQRQDWWLGPRIGAGFAELRPLFAFIPEAERAGLITLLGELSVPARADLALLARRLPEGERDQLRRALLALSAEQREQRIRERLSAPLLP